MMYCALSKGSQFGWGTLGTNLLAELQKRTSAIDLNEKPNLWHKPDGTVLHTIKNHNFETELPVWGERNVGYGFWEFVIPEAGIERAKKFDLIFAGSTWGKEHLAQFGIESKVIIQGVDRELWHPDQKPKDKLYQDWFVVVSIGKFELRKGQDIALAAMKVIQDRHKDVLFVNVWENKWRESMRMMEISRFIEYRHLPELPWVEQMAALYMLNRLHPGRIISYPLVDQRTLRRVIHNSDLGLFTNRCEAGTNLALMEYMACGKPAVASYNTGHKDVIYDENSLPLMHMNPFEVRKEDDSVLCKWEEPDIEEVIEQIEWAYQNRKALKICGDNAARDMREFTWGRTAETVLMEVEAHGFQPTKHG